MKIEENRKVPLDSWGKYFAARHQHGIWRSCAVSGKYHFAEHLFVGNNFINRMKHALTKTLVRHTNLCYGVVEKSLAEEAHLFQLVAIDWDDIIEFHSLEAREDDVKLSESIEVGHQYLFKDQYRKPAWKLIVLQYDCQPGSCDRRVDIIFVVHHAITDGTGGAAFHRNLLQNLQAENTLPRAEDYLVWPYVVPKSIPKPIYVEDSFSQLTLAPLPPRPGVHPSFDPWTSIPPFLASIDSYKSRAAIITIPFTSISKVLAYCRSRSITFTGLLHALILSFLARNIPSAQTFRGDTPLSMRRFTQTSDDEIVDQISITDHDWPPKFVSLFRDSIEGSIVEEEAIIAVAKLFQEQVRDEISVIPTTGGYGLRLVAGIEDLDLHCEDGMKAKKRGSTYEVSNVGLVKIPRDEDGKREMVLEKLVFSQSASVTGVALGCSVISLAGGPLTLCLHWQEHAIDERLVEGVHEYLKKRLMTTV